MPPSPQKIIEKPFEVPRNGQVYITAIVERCRQLIDTQIWMGISPSALDGWLANFIGDREKYFAACILDSLVYRSEEQTVSLTREIFDRELSTHYERKNINTFPFDDLAKYFHNYPPEENRPIAIVPVIRRNEPPTKSGPMIARMLKRQLHVNQYHMLWPWQVKEWQSLFKTRHIIFIDDLLGTGMQFCNFLKEFDLDSTIGEFECVYSPLVAHERGIKKIKEKFPSIELLPVERLSETNNIFHHSSRPFNDGVNCPKSAKKLYIEILRRIGYTNTASRNGFGNLGIAYAFHHGTPNNSIPILWWDKPGQWFPLLKR